MNGKIRKILKGILLLILIIGVLRLGMTELENFRSRQAYDTALRIATSKTETPEDADPSGDTAPPTEEETAPGEETAETEETGETGTQPPEEPAPVTDPHIQELLEINLAALKEVNPDVLGWIHIPDTNISYPIMQGTDNEFYLKHNWEKVANYNGSVFMECQNDPAFTDFNTILYGHNMLDKSIFGALKDYTGQVFLENHPYVYIVREDGVIRYDIFAVYRAAVGSTTYSIKISSERRREEFIRYSLDYSYMKTGIVPTAEDSILTLSTCTGDGYSARWVVQAVLNEEASYLLP